MGAEDLAKEVLLYSQRHRMFRRGEGVVVAVSGGPDSVALLDILFSLRSVLGIRLFVAHFNHRLRGDDSDEDQQAVERRAQRYGLKPYSGGADVAAFAKKTRRGVEESARHLRYQFLEHVRSETGAAKVALGHNANDQAETVLFHFLRGSGTAGLAGMPPVRGPFVRPLLGVRRSTIEKYCKLAGLQPRTDASNFNVDFTRNRIRIELIPSLQADYNPNLVATLLRTAEIIRADEHFMQGEAERVFGTLARIGEDEVTFGRSDLMNVPLALRRRLLRLAWSRLSGRDDLSFDQVERCLEMLCRKESAIMAELPGGVYMAKEQVDVTFTYAYARDEVPLYAYPLPLPGVVDLPEAGAAIECTILDKSGIPDPRNLHPHRAVIDLDHLAEPFTVRNRRPGDVFQPFGAGETRLKKFLNGLKVDRRDRDRLPLVVDGLGRIAWVAGLRTAEWCRVGDSTSRALLLEIRREDPN